MRTKIETYYITVNNIEYEVEAQVIFTQQSTDTLFDTIYWEEIEEVDIREVKNYETTEIIIPTIELEEQLIEKISIEENSWMN